MNSTYDTNITDTGAFAVQIVDRETGAIVGEANDLDTIGDALDYVRRFYDALN